LEQQAKGAAAVKIWIGLAILGVATPAQAEAQTQAPSPSPAQPAPDAEAYEDIVVEGIKSPYRLTPAQLREAVAAYNAERAALAPNAPLRFQVFRYRLDPALSGVRFRLVADGAEAIPIDVNEDGEFSLPPVDFAKQRYSLQANRKAGTVRLEPSILSPGSTESNSRLGDMRLSCAVSWAMMRQNISIPIRAMVGMAGGVCASSKIAIFFGTEQALASARVVDGTNVTSVSLKRDGSAFRYPGYIKTLPNDARVILEYK